MKRIEIIPLEIVNCKPGNRLRIKFPVFIYEDKISFVTTYRAEHDIPGLKGAFDEKYTRTIMQVGLVCGTVFDCFADDNMGGLHQLLRKEST